MAETNGTSSMEVVDKAEEQATADEVDTKKDEAVVDDQKPVENKVVATKKQDLSPEVLAKKIKRQIEYYFGDFNLPTDKFLQNIIKEKDGWVPLETLLKFNRLASLSTNCEDIISALENSELVQISEDKTELRRNPEKPLPVENEARRKEILERSLYVKGFPQEDFTMDTAVDFLDPYGPIDDVVLRYWQDKAENTWKFKGSIFIKFATKEAAQKFLDVEDMKFNDKALIKMWQTAYLDEKRKERLEEKLAKRPNSDKHNNKKHAAKKMKTEEEKKEPLSLPKNATLFIAECPKELRREKLKEKVEQFGVTVAFIDHNPGDDQAWIRLHDEGTAAKVMAECKDGVLKLDEGLEVTMKILEGEEEATFLESAQQKINARKNFPRKRSNNRSGGRGGRGGGHWRKRRNQDSDGFGGKKTKLDNDGSD